MATHRLAGAQAPARVSGRDAARWLALGAAAGPVLFTAAWLVLGFISPGYTAWGSYVPYSPIHQGVSGLGLGSTAPYMNAAFLANGVLSLVGVLAVFRNVDGMSSAARWTCGAILALPAVGSIVDGMFTLESFVPHFAGFGLVLTTIVSFPVVGVLLRRTQDWRRFGTWLILGGPLTLTLTVLYFVTFTPTIAGTQQGIAGLTERVLIVEVLGWFVAMGRLAFRTGRGVRP